MEIFQNFSDLIKLREVREREEWRWRIDLEERLFKWRVYTNKLLRLDFSLTSLVKVNARGETAVSAETGRRLLARKLA